MFCSSLLIGRQKVSADRKSVYWSSLIPETGLHHRGWAREREPTLNSLQILLSGINGQSTARCIKTAPAKVNEGRASCFVMTWTFCGTTHFLSCSAPRADLKTQWFPKCRDNKAFMNAGTSFACLEKSRFINEVSKEAQESRNLGQPS